VESRLGRGAQRVLVAAAYHWGAEFRWNQCTTISAVTLSPLSNTNDAPQSPLWRHPQNRKYITHRNAVVRGSSDGHRQQAQTIRRSSVVWFSRYANGQTDRHIHRNTRHPSSRGGA